MKILKIIGGVLAAIALLISAGLVYFQTALPKVQEPTELDIEITSERVIRGEYLANSVCACMDCHSTRDWQLYSGPLKEGTLGKGGEIFNQDFGFPGVFTSKNITPAGISDWTDGELFRLITTGVTKSNEPIFPVMPYLKYGQMAEEDVYAIIAYLRSLEPIENDVVASKADFPMNFILRTIPKNSSPQPIPDKNDQIAYGAYLTNAAACADCHTPQDKGQPIEGLEFAGGFEFKLPEFGTIRSANITPDPETGIGNWTEEFFVQKFKAYVDSSYIAPELTQGDMQTVMPWTMYGNMTEEDLKAIYAYLKTVKPVKNKFKKHSPLAGL